ncbi:carbohydrate kinase [Actinocorallia sp. A-T 12471]|uniref:carbohydrate kinase family protein n=1 Tax=Actinocorallia sp. A-T 12471 TaxID=3089813 RepID=UPI0029D165FE|nr:carbohydrate kinase [Actinocorallia sp. A-T 12471]MDX6740770.1 carbohydrate kinase [Actinocorallia sp. A-T 12471]
MISVVGEALIDVLATDGAPPVVRPGGSPLNVAVGLGRQGVPVALLTRFGADPDGDVLAAHLRDSGVDLVGDPRDDLPTSTATARLDPSGTAEYTFRLDWRIPDEPLPETTTCLHTGSLAACLAPGADRVLDLLREWHGRAVISYDPNIRPSLMGDPAAARQRVDECAALADVVKASADDIAWLHPELPVDQVAAGWLTLGPSLVVVTRGAKGATGYLADGTVPQAAVPVEVVDTVGAGDAFTSGLLTGLHARDLLTREALGSLTPFQLAPALADAAASAAATCARPGADPPHPSR